jgi:hypothetical protein
MVVARVCFQCGVRKGNGGGAAPSSRTEGQVSAFKGRRDEGHCGGDGMARRQRPGSCGHGHAQMGAESS